MTKTDLEKRFDPLFERMSKADISLNRLGFYKQLRQELKREREEMGKFLLKHGHGGGNWRRLIINYLKEKEVKWKT